MLRSIRNTKKRQTPTAALQGEQLEIRKVLSAVSVAQADLSNTEQLDTSAHTIDADNNDGLRSAALTGSVQRIINGEQTSDYDAVGIVNDQCSGTLIAPNAVLTAAHCVEGLSPSQGSFEVGGQRYEVESFHVHSNQNADLAVMILKENVQGITPYQLNRTTPQVGQMLTLVGFGATGDGNSGHNGSFGTKHVGQTPIDQVTNDLIIWNFDNNSESNTAPGDSGGPAFITVDGQLLLSGVTSGGDREDAAIGDTSYDGRVDSFVDWIDSVAGTSANDGGGGDSGGDDDSDGGDDDNSGGETTGVFSSSGTVKIPGNKVSTVTMPIDVSGMAGGLVDIDVKLNIKHTWNEDLQVTLISPSGTRVELFDAVGGDSNNFKNTVLDDDAATRIEDGRAPFRGTFLPMEDLNALNGEDANGRWTLEVTDHFDLDGGRINKVELKVTTDGSGNTGGNEGDNLDQLAIRVDTEHDLYFNGNDFFNWGGENEKWMNGNNGWYFITPDGSFYEWDYSSGATGTLIATFDASFHDDPSLLYNAADNNSRMAQVSVEGIDADLMKIAAATNADYDLEFTGDYFEDWADGGEKWLMSNQGWTYLTPQGGLFAWSGNGRALTGDLIVQLSSDFYHNPELLHDAADVATTQTADNAAATDADVVDSVFAQVNEEDELFVF